jgi:hypothetical protein
VARSIKQYFSHVVEYAKMTGLPADERLSYRKKYVHIDHLEKKMLFSMNPDQILHTEKEVCLKDGYLLRSGALSNQFLIFVSNTL